MSLPHAGTGIQEGLDVARSLTEVCREIVSGKCDVPLLPQMVSPQDNTGDRDHLWEYLSLSVADTHTKILFISLSSCQIPYMRMSLFLMVYHVRSACSALHVCELHKPR